MADSRDVARYFGKRPDNVLRDIRAIQAECSRDFSRLNFEVRTENQTHSRGARTVSYVLMTFDGFMMVIMNYTGMVPQKEAYIAEFKRRGDEIQRLREMVAGRQTDDIHSDLGRWVEHCRKLARSLFWCAAQLEKAIYRTKAPELPLFAGQMIVIEPDTIHAAPQSAETPPVKKKRAKKI
jgi:Rha family phage regulatory protein